MTHLIFGNTTPPPTCPTCGVVGVPYHSCLCTNCLVRRDVAEHRRRAANLAKLASEHNTAADKLIASRADLFEVTP